MINPVRVRIAPSPTGYLHIGTLYTALFNVLFARHHKGSFIVRIEDTDRSRFVEGAQEAILRTLDWAGIPPDEGPFVQSTRLEIYSDHVQQLLDAGKAYWCNCTSERLDEMRKLQEANRTHLGYDGHCRELGLTEGLVVRLKVPESRSFDFIDMIRGDISIQAGEVDDQVLLKSDGFPTYHLAVVVDDHLMGISHVIRGEEWISSTPKHILLYEAFGWEKPEFAHLPLLLGADRKKLSKRKGDVSVQQYIDNGYLPEALLNFLATQAWNPTSDREIYTMQELVDVFDIHRVNTGGSIVNFEKLDWMNGQYIRMKSVEELADLVKPFLKTELSREVLLKAVTLVQDRLVVLSDFEKFASFVWELPEYDKTLLVWKKGSAAQNQVILPELIKFFEGLPDDQFEAGILETTLKAWIAEKGFNNGEVLWPLRVALAGLEQSPPPFAIASALGKTETLRRLHWGQR